MALGRHREVLGLLEVLHGFAPFSPFGVVGPQLTPRCRKLLVVASSLFHQLTTFAGGQKAQQSGLPLQQYVSGSFDIGRVNGTISDKEHSYASNVRL